MHLLCVGISHVTAPLEIRERLWYSEDEVRALLPRFRGFGLKECVLFSTCNRTELYAFGDSVVAQVERLQEFLIAEKHASADVRHNHLFTYTGGKAVEHLFRVATGIDSMILGDVQILSQVKKGFSIAEEVGTSGFFTHRLFQAALHVGKRARTETRIGEGAISVSYAAVELAGKIFDDLSTKTALIIGAGETAELTAKHLRGKNIGKLLITNRTAERAERLAQHVHGSVLPYDSFRTMLGQVDIILSSVESNGYILTADEVQAIQRYRSSTALFMIDVGVPRNIDPAARALENVFLYDIDNLQGLVDDNLDKRRREVPAVERIIAAELDAFTQWHTSLEANPTIVALRALAEQIRKEEVDRNINRFSTRDRELLDILTTRIVNKILHAPITNLKNGRNESPTERLQKIRTLRSLFGIDRSPEEHDHDS
jgi:glutamyl-tRNA reductase